MRFPWDYLKVYIKNETRNPAFHSITFESASTYP